MSKIEKVKKLIKDKSVLLYKSKTEYGTVKGYIQKIDEVGINQVNFIVYYPTKLKCKCGTLIQHHFMFKKCSIFTILE